MNILQKLFGAGPKVNLKTMIDEGALLVDVRSPAEFAEGHVNGSVNIPLDKITLSLPKFKDKKNIIVFCRSGNRSAMAKTLLEQNGIKNIVNGGTWEDINKFVQ